MLIQNFSWLGPTVHEISWSVVTEGKTEN